MDQSERRVAKAQELPGMLLEGIQARKGSEARDSTGRVSKTSDMARSASQSCVGLASLCKTCTCGMVDGTNGNRRLSIIK